VVTEPACLTKELATIDGGQQTHLTALPQKGQEVLASAAVLAG
jgi:hypothetical protein